MTSLTTTEFSSLSIGALQSLSPAVVAATAPATFAALGAKRVASLTTTQIASLSSEQIATFGTAKLATLTAAQISSINPAALAALGAKRIAMLNMTQVDALTSAQIGALNANELNSLNHLNSLTTNQLSLVNMNKINHLGGAFVSKLNAASLRFDQINSLTGTTISQLTTAFFDNISNSEYSAIAVKAISSVTTTQLNSLSQTQLIEFNPQQIYAMSADQQKIVANVNPYVVQATLMAKGGQFSYDNALQMLKEAAASPMTDAKFAQLQSFANKLQDYNEALITDANDAVLTTPAVKQLFDNVVLGNVENKFSGNDSAPTGDLSATSSQTQFGTLIDKWFLGGDLPGLQSDYSGNVLAASYQSSGLQLFGPTGSPQLQDIVQNGVADSALLAGLAEVTMHAPDYIKSLFTNNGNGTYTVELPSEFGTSNFVTVNDQIPVGTGATNNSQPTSSTGMWVGLLEKAVAQDFVNVSISDGGQIDSFGKTYAALTLPQSADDLLSLFPGQAFYEAAFQYSPQSYITDSLSAASNMLNQGGSAIFERGNDFYAVTGIDASAGTVDVYSTATGKNSTITASTSAIQNDAIFYSVR